MRSYSALELVAHHAGPAADISLGDRRRLTAGGCEGIQRGVDVVVVHVSAEDVVEGAVVALADDGLTEDERQLGPELAERPGDGRIANRADAVGVGGEQRSDDVPDLIDDMRTGQLADTVEIVSAGVHRKAVGPGQDRGEAGADRPCTDLEWAITLDQRDVVNGHTGDVCDGIQRPRCAVERDTEISSPRPAGPGPAGVDAAVTAAVSAAAAADWLEPSRAASAARPVACTNDRRLMPGAPLFSCAIDAIPSLDWCHTSRSFRRPPKRRRIGRRNLRAPLRASMLPPSDGHPHQTDGLQAVGAGSRRSISTPMSPADPDDSVGLGG